jgi:hypothetical protein
MRPYSRTETRVRLVTELKDLGIPRLDAEDAVAGKRPTSR